MASENSGFSRERLLILLVLVLAGLHGLVYVFLMPPWQHYDEPNHFEVVWLAAKLDRLPVPGDYSPKLSRQVLKSMIANGFYSRFDAVPEIGPVTEKVRIPGYSQLAEPPLYYTIASLPLRLMPSQGVKAQLYAARLVSWLFFLLTILISFGIAFELSPKGHPLRWLLPLTLVLTPAFVDLMTAVNNDAAAVAVSSALVWSSVRLVRRGASLFDLVLVFGLAALAFLTKITSLVVLVALFPTLLFAFFRGRWRWVAWGALFLGSIGLAFGIFRRDDPFGWYRNTSQIGPARIHDAQAPVGEYLLAVESGAIVTPSYYANLFQHLPLAAAEELAGQQVTFGYWIWSDQEQRVRAPILRTTSQTFSETLTVSKEPAFFAFQTVIPQDTDRIWIELEPSSTKSSSNIFYDGLVLAEGQFPVSEIPEFSSPDGRAGMWSGQPFENWIQNGSAEQAGIRLAAWFDNPAAQLLPDQARPSLLVATLFDWNGSGDLYRNTIKHLFETYWIRFGWGNVPAAGEPLTERLVFYFSIIGIIGAAAGALHHRRKVPWEIVVTMGIFVIPIVLMAVTRGGAYLESPGFYLPTARYIYPAIVPLALLLNCGWLEIIFWIQLLGQRILRQGDNDLGSGLTVKAGGVMAVEFALFTAFFLTISLLSLSGINNYYKFSPSKVNTPIPVQTQVAVIPSAAITGEVTQEAVIEPTVLSSPPVLPSPPAQPVPGIELHQADSDALDLAEQAGAHWIRRNSLDWAAVEPVEGARNWNAVAELEDEMKSAAERGFQQIIIVRGTPDWAQKTTGYTCSAVSPQKITAFARFIHDAVERYHSALYHVKYWELGNEPDVDPSFVPPDSPFGCWGDQSDPFYGGGYYSEVLREAFPQLKSADPQAQLLIGGLLMDCDPVNPPEGKDCTPSLFLEGILRSGGGEFFDGISFHAYDYYNEKMEYANPNWNSNWNSNGPVLVVKARYIRSLLAAYQQPQKYLLNTEAGLICPEADEGADCESEGYELSKASYVAQVNTVALAERLQANIWYSLTGWRGTGLVDGSGNPNLAYQAYRFNSGWLAGAAYVRAVNDIPGVRGYEFHRDRERIQVLWSIDGKDHTYVYEQAPLAVYNLLGEPGQSGGEVTITHLPIYIEWGK